MITLDDLSISKTITVLEFANGDIKFFDEDKSLILETNKNTIEDIEVCSEIIIDYNDIA